MVNIRGLRHAPAELYHTSDYSVFRTLAAPLRGSRLWGIVYDSVRHVGGECAAVLRPPALADCRQAQHLSHVWNGSSISGVYEKRTLKL